MRKQQHLSRGSEGCFGIFTSTLFFLHFLSYSLSNWRVRILVDSPKPNKISYIFSSIQRTIFFSLLFSPSSFSIPIKLPNQMGLVSNCHVANNYVCTIFSPHPWMKIYYKASIILCWKVDLIISRFV